MWPYEMLLHMCLFLLMITKLMFNLQEGVRRTIDSYQSLRAGAPIRREIKGPSKAELLLGNGKGANLLLCN